MKIASVAMISHVHHTRERIVQVIPTTQASTIPAINTRNVSVLIKMVVRKIYLTTMAIANAGSTVKPVPVRPNIATRMEVAPNGRPPTVSIQMVNLKMQVVIVVVHRQTRVPKTLECFALTINVPLNPIQDLRLACRVKRAITWMNTVDLFVKNVHSGCIHWRWVLLCAQVVKRDTVLQTTWNRVPNVKLDCINLLKRQLNIRANFVHMAMGSRAQ